MDLKSARAVLLPSEGKSFDPTKISRAVKGVGFTPGEIEVTAVGTLSTEDDLLRLNMSGPVPQMILAGGPKLEELRNRQDLMGRKLKVTGTLHPLHGDQPPGITIEQWMPVTGSE